MEKTICIGGKDVRMRATALIPRLYRFKFGRDLISDMRILQKALKRSEELSENATEEERRDAQFSVLELTIFENVAYLMVKNAGEPIPDSPEEWLDGIDGVFPIYEALPAMMELWGLNQMTTSTPKKK